MSQSSLYPLPWTSPFPGPLPGLSLEHDWPSSTTPSRGVRNVSGKEEEVHVRVGCVWKVH